MSDTLSREDSLENDDDKTKINKQVYCQLRKLHSWLNPRESTAVEEYKKGREILPMLAKIALFSTNVIEEPTTFEEAWNYCDKDE